MTGCKFNKNFLYSQQFCKCFPPNRKNTRCTPATNAATTPQIPDSQHVTKGHLLRTGRRPFVTHWISVYYTTTTKIVAECRPLTPQRPPCSHLVIKPLLAFRHLFHDFIHGVTNQTLHEFIGNIAFQLNGYPIFFV